MERVIRPHDYNDNFIFLVIRDSVYYARYPVLKIDWDQMDEEIQEIMWLRLEKELSRAKIKRVTDLERRFK